MSEQDMRRKVVKLLRDWDAVSVENRVHPGTPDVNHIHGWVELKWLRHWPSQPETVVNVEVRPEQRVWLKRRARAGGSVYLLLQVRREWLLFTGPTAALQVGYVTRERLYAHAIHHSTMGMDAERLKQWLTPK